MRGVFRDEMRHQNGLLAKFSLKHANPTAGYQSLTMGIRGVLRKSWPAGTLVAKPGTGGRRRALLREGPERSVPDVAAQSREDCFWLLTPSNTE